MARTKVPDPPKWRRKAGTADPMAVHHGSSLVEKAAQADACIKDYCYSEIAKGRGPRDRTSDITSLLTDLMHLCDREGDDFEKFLEQSTRHYRAEIDGD